MFDLNALTTHILQHCETAMAEGFSAPATALIMIMACCVVATPLSLLLTVPAYIMTDKVSKRLQT